jgi:trk system potassium uptake protein TrkH
MNVRAVLAVLGFILIVVGVLMGAALPFSFQLGGGDGLAIIVSSAITLFAGISLWLFGRAERHDVGKREGFAIVALGWVVASLFGCLPFILSGVIPSFTDAFFETMSGFTTTGATILPNIEAVPFGVLFWRSLTQWIGGMGIILLSVAILPLLGVGGMQLFDAEVPGLTVEKLTPRISHTARILWMVYALFTALEAGLLMIGGMSLFDALCHSFTTLSTGGFSTKNASIAHFQSPFIQYVIITFMFIAATNFTLHYRALKGDVKGYFQNNEFVFYLLVVLGAVLVVSIGIASDYLPGVEEKFRAALFQAVSITTTTGFITADYQLWAPAVQLIFMLMMFHGGSAGSTAGGMKLARILLMLKNGSNEIKRLVHPKAVIPVRFNGRAVEQEIITEVLAFFGLFISLFVFMTIVMAALGMDIKSAAGAVAATLGNIGPGFGSVGPVDTYAHVPVLGKWVLSFCMLTGRLELFTILVLFSPVFWKR